MSVVLATIHELGWSAPLPGATEVVYFDRDGEERTAASMEQLTRAFATGAGTGIGQDDDDKFLFAGPDSWLTEANFRISVSHTHGSITEAEFSRLAMLWCGLAREVDLVAGYLCDRWGLETLDRASMNRWFEGRGNLFAVIWDPQRYRLTTKLGTQIAAGPVSCRLYQATWRDQPLEGQLRAALSAAP